VKAEKVEIRKEIGEKGGDPQEIRAETGDPQCIRQRMSGSEMKSAENGLTRNGICVVGITTYFSFCLLLAPP
jgi:hypothetical protein